MKKVNETFATKQASVTAVASNIVAEAVRDTVTIRNTGASTVYVGAAGVTSATGFPILANEALTMEATTDVYAVTATGSTSTVAILEER